VEVEREAIPAPSPASSFAGGLATVALLVALAFNAIAALTQAMSVRALTHTYRRQKAQEMEYRQYQVVAQRQAEVEAQLAEDGDWRPVLAQVLAEAVPDADTTWLTVAGVSCSPVPRLDVTGQDGRQYVFTVAPNTVRQRLTLRRDWMISLDASLSPTVRVEVQAVWEHLAQQRNLDLRTLPRRAEWYLVERRGDGGFLSGLLRRGGNRG
jgi:hypothetical protein